MIGIALLLFALDVATSNNTICHRCHAPNAQYCEGERYKCPDGSVCMTVYERLGCNHTYISIQKRCSMNLKCNEEMYAYVDEHVFVELSRLCCEGDLCNSGAVSIKSKTYPFDGPECPICASYDTTDLCKPVGTTVCRQATDQCGGLAGWMTKPDNVTTKFSVRGCMSKNACKYDHTEMIGYHMKMITYRNCFMPKPKNDTSTEETQGY